MKYIDATFARPEENLACDEALLDCAEEQGGPEVLRFWESPMDFVVLGYGNKAEKEIELSACRREGIPVLRRSSGGGAVLQGPGVLNYALVLGIHNAWPVESISAANRFIMERHRAALEALLNAGQKITVQGHTDLTLGDKKFSGNAQRRKREFLLFHGTVLHKFDLSKMRYLRMPSRQPDYRQGRGHEEFVQNFPKASQEIRDALRRSWPAQETLDGAPIHAIERLIREKYGRPEWNLRS